MFVNAYSGDIIATMKALGHSGDDIELMNKGRTMLQNPNVREALRSRYTYTVDQKKNIADKDELLEWWTSLVKNRDPHNPESDGKVPIKDRIKASELIGKSHIMFGDKKEIEHKVTITNIIEDAYKLDDTDIEDIEYTEVKKPKQVEEVIL